jgi:hypothetical protein
VPQARSVLLIVERAYRGGVEAQFADVLYFIRELHRQSGGADLALRGLAASYAVDTGFVPALRIAGATIDTLTDPRQGVRKLIAEGAGVWVEEPDLAALGRHARDRLLPGVRCLAGHGLAVRWPEYERVWFM